MTEAVTIAGIEAALLDRLRARIAGVAIEPFFPDDPETYTLLHQVGALLLAYAGAEDGSPEALGVVVQERVLRFDVHVVARRLSGAGGAQRLQEAARRTLLGDSYVGRGKGTWIYALTVAVPTVAVAEAAAPEEPPAAAQIVFEGV